MKRFQPRLLALIPVGIILGFLVTRQYTTAKETTRLQTSDENAIYALEIESLIQRTQKLRGQVSILNEKKAALEQTTTDRSKNQVELDKEGATLTVIDGSTKVSGAGVRVKIQDKMERENVVDLLNAVRNMGAEALAINGHRISGKTGIRNLGLTAPYTFEFIGDPDILNNGLIRPGGILAQLRVKAEIERSELILPPAK